MIKYTYKVERSTSVVRTEQSPLDEARECGASKTDRCFSPPNNESEVFRMCNANDSIISKVQELMELRKMIEELQSEAEIITDEIKSYMGDEETMMAGSFKVTWKQSVSRRVDTTALKKVLGDALDEYTKTIVTRPFKVI